MEERNMRNMKKFRNIIMTLAVAVALVLTVVNVNIATAPTVAAESESINASNIDVDAVVQLLSADNYKDISCSATSEVVDAARKEGGNTIKEIVETYLKVDNNYPRRLVKRFGTSILI